MNIHFSQNRDLVFGAKNAPPRRNHWYSLAGHDDYEFYTDATQAKERLEAANPSITVQGKTDLYEYRVEQIG